MSESIVGFDSVIELVAEEFYKFVGYKVRPPEAGRAYQILYSHLDDIKKAVIADQKTRHITDTFLDLVRQMIDEVIEYANGKDTTEEDILAYFTPLLEQTVAVDKYINESAEGIMDDYPEDGGMQDKTDFFISLKEKKKLIESKLSAINSVITQIMPELIMWIENNPASDLVATNGKKASIRTSYYPKVTNLQSLKDSLAESWSEFEGVNMKKLGELVREMRDRAKISGDNIHELLPPGVDVAITKTLTVSAPGSKTKRSSDNGINELVDMIMDRKNNGEGVE